MARNRTNWKRLAREQGRLLVECERVLVLIPAKHNPELPRYLELLQSEYIAPLIKKLREP